MGMNDYFSKSQNSVKQIILFMIKKLVLGLIISGIWIAVVLFTQGISETSITNALFIGGIVLVVMGCFSFLINQAFFDIVAYNVIRFTNFVKQYKDKSFYGTYEYTKSKEEKRKSTRWVCLIYLVPGLILILASIIYLLV